MNIKVKHLVLMSALICLAVVLILPGCAQTPQEPEPTAPPATTSPKISSTQTPTAVPPPAPAPTGAIIAKLSFSEPPVLGKPVQIIATFTLRENYKRDASNTVARIILNEGFELVDGNLKWEGALPRGSSAEIKATVKAIKTGENRIDSGAQAYSSDGAELTFGGTSIYAIVSENSAEVSDVPHRPTGIQSPTPALPPPGYKGPTPVPPVPRTGPEPPYQPLPPDKVPVIPTTQDLSPGVKSVR